MNRMVAGQDGDFWGPTYTTDNAKGYWKCTDTVYDGYIAQLRGMSGMCLDQYSHCLCRLNKDHGPEHWCPCGNKWNDEP